MWQISLHTLKPNYVKKFPDDVVFKRSACGTIRMRPKATIIIHHEANSLLIQKCCHICSSTVFKTPSQTASLPTGQNWFQNLHIEYFDSFQSLQSTASFKDSPICGEFCEMKMDPKTCCVKLHTSIVWILVSFEVTNCFLGGIWSTKPQDEFIFSPPTSPDFHQSSCFFVSSR